MILTQGEKTCGDCNGRGFLWFKDRRVPWIPRHPFIESAGVYGDALFCRSVKPCPQCRPDAHAQWSVDFEWSERACRLQTKEAIWEYLEETGQRVMLEMKCPTCAEKPVEVFYRRVGDECVMRCRCAQQHEWKAREST
jgi:hypothetical protein